VPGFPPGGSTGALGTSAGLPVEQVFAYDRIVADLPSPEVVENRRRSIAMLAQGAPALNRDEALKVLRQLVEALREVQELRRRLDS
jgi:hypothetical protein